MCYFSLGHQQNKSMQIYCSCPEHFQITWNYVYFPFADYVPKLDVVSCKAIQSYCNVKTVLSPKSSGSFIHFFIIYVATSSLPCDSKLPTQGQKAAVLMGFIHKVGHQ